MSSSQCMSMASSSPSLDQILKYFIAGLYFVSAIVATAQYWSSASTKLLSHRRIPLVVFHVTVAIGLICRAGAVLVKKSSVMGQERFLDFTILALPDAIFFVAFSATMLHWSTVCRTALALSSGEIQKPDFKRFDQELVNLSMRTACSVLILFCSAASCAHFILPSNPLFPIMVAGGFTSFLAIIAAGMAAFYGSMILSTLTLAFFGNSNEQRDGCCLAVPRTDDGFVEISDDVDQDNETLDESNQDEIGSKVLETAQRVMTEVKSTAKIVIACHSLKAVSFLVLDFWVCSNTSVSGYGLRSYGVSEITLSILWATFSILTDLLPTWLLFNLFRGNRTTPSKPNCQTITKHEEKVGLGRMEQVEQLANSSSALNQFTSLLSPHGPKCSTSKLDTFVDEHSMKISVSSPQHVDDFEELEFQMKIHFQIRQLNALLQLSTNLARSTNFENSNP